MAVACVLVALVACAVWMGAWAQQIPCIKVDSTDPCSLGSKIWAYDSGPLESYKVFCEIRPSTCKSGPGCQPDDCQVYTPVTSLDDGWFQFRDDMRSCDEICSIFDLPCQVYPMNLVNSEDRMTDVEFRINGYFCDSYEASTTPPCLGLHLVIIILLVSAPI